MHTQIASVRQALKIVSMSLIILNYFRFYEAEMFALTDGEWSAAGYRRVSSLASQSQYISNPGNIEND